MDDGGNEVLGSIQSSQSQRIAIASPPWTLVGLVGVWVS